MHDPAVAMVPDRPEIRLFRLPALVLLWASARPPESAGRPEAIRSCPCFMMT